MIRAGVALIIAIAVGLLAGGGCLLSACDRAEESAHASEATAGPNQKKDHAEAVPTQPVPRTRAPGKSAQSQTEPDETSSPRDHGTSGQPPNAPADDAAGDENGLDATMTLVLDGRPGKKPPFSLPEPWVYPLEPGQSPPPPRWAEVDEPRRDPLQVVNTGDRIAIVLRPGDVVLESSDGQSWAPFLPDRPIVDLVPGEGYWWSLTGIDRWGLPTRVARSEDRGRTWELRMTGEHLDPLPKLFRRGGQYLVLATGEHLLWTRDTREWTFIQPGIHGTISALWTEDPRSSREHAIWWAGGENSTVAHGHVKGDWVVEKLPGLADDQAVYGFARGGKDGALFAATERGLFRRDGPLMSPIEKAENPRPAGSWSQVESLGGRTFYGVRFFSDEVGVAFGASGELAATVDGGATWTRHTEQALAAVGVDRDHVSARALLDINWRFAEPAGDGLVLVGDDMLVLYIESGHLR